MTAATDALSAAQQLLAHNPTTALDAARRALSRPAGPDRNELHLLAADAAWRLGRTEQSAWHLSRSAPAPEQQARALILRARHASRLGQDATATEYARQAARSAQQHGDTHDESNALNLLAQLQHQTGQTQDALHTADALVRVRRRNGDPDALIRALCNQALLMTSLGHLHDALTTLNDAQALLPTCAQPARSGLLVYSNLGMLHEQTGRTAEAYAQFIQAREAAVRAGDAYAEAAMGLNAGDMARQHHHPDAETLLITALGAARDLNNPGLQASALHSLGLLHASHGDAERAEAALEAGDALAQQSGNHSVHLDILLARAQIRLNSSDPNRAEHDLHEALRLADRASRPRDTLQIHRLLAQLHERSDPAQAVVHLKAAAELSEHLHDVTLAKQIRDVTVQAELSGVRREIQHERSLRLASEQAVTRALADVERERFYDALTSLPNRVLGQALLNRAAQQHPGQVSVALLNLLRFKSVNSAFGYAGGDELLREVTERLLGTLHPGDLLARTSNDEFMIVLVGPDPATREARAHDILAAMHHNFSVQDLPVNIQASVGLAHHPTDGVTGDDLQRAAHLALDEARDAPRSVRCYAPDSHDRQTALHFEAALALALERQEFELHYQPIVDAHTGQARTAEALLRWNSRDLGWQSPAEFIPALERTGLIVPVGAWVLEQACRDASRWADVRVAVNLSARQFQEGDLIRTVDHALRVSGLPPERLELEITESLMIQSPQRVTETLLALRERGVHVMLDDFGTGYSNLSLLGTLPVTGLKIDRTFVTALQGGQNLHAQAMIRAIIQLSHALDLDLIAEGIEQPSERDVLRDLGVRHLQGFLFARPTPHWTP